MSLHQLPDVVSPEAKVDLQLHHVALQEEEQGSHSFPGLYTVYRRPAQPEAFGSQNSTALTVINHHFPTEIVIL